MSEKRGAITRSVRIPAELNEWAQDEGINVNGTLIAALEARRGECNIPERIAELSARKERIESELNRLAALDTRRRMRAGDLAIIRSVVMRIQGKYGGDVPQIAPMRDLGDELNGELLHSGKVLSSFSTAHKNAEISNAVRDMWVSCREESEKKWQAAREKMIMDAAKEGTVKM